MAEGEISFSLGPLQKLGATFAQAGTGPWPTGSQKAALGLLAQLGDTAVPLLLRKLAGGSGDEASWAYFLLAQLGGERVVSGARALVDAEGTADDRKALGLALLSELGAELPGEVTLSDPDALRSQSVSDLIARLSEPADVARAAELLIEQVAPPDLAALVGEMAEIAGGAITPLVDELLARDDVDPEARPALIALRARLPEGAPLPRPRGRAAAWLGRAADGRRVVLATRVHGGGPRRALALSIDAGGHLVAAEHHPELTAKRGLGLLQASWRARGFRLRRTRLRDAARWTAEALVATRRAARRVPGGFYLGRDLLGLDPATLGGNTVSAVAPTERRLAAARRDLLEAERLLDAGDAAGAAREAAKYVARAPDDAEGRSLYAMCLGALGQHTEALAHAAAAAHLAPEEPAYHWNHAHAAKQAGKMGASWLALERYLASGDQAEGADERREIARKFMALFERYARIEHPGASVANVARCEELFERALGHLAAGRHAEAQSAFEAVLVLVPSHHPSWSNLGASLIAERKYAEAEKCLRRALDLRPDYELARKNLELIPG